MNQNPLQFLGRVLPECMKQEVSGKLFVIEGADGSGRSTQIASLGAWLESRGYAVKHMGIKRSMLVSNELANAQEGNVLTRTTLSLFYATDFFDQLINEIIPALRAGLIVLADRYIYTLMARDMVRGAEREWVRNLYSPAIIPHAVLYFHVSPKRLVERNFEKKSSLDYWESGMDLGLSRDMFDSFVKYQRMLQTQFRTMQEEFGFEVINGNRHVDTIQLELRSKVEHLLTGE
jgi:dTMP kinase